LATLVGVEDAVEEPAGPDVRQRSIADRPQDPKRRAELERLYAEMVEARAPATEGPIVDHGRRRTRRLLFGDATE